MIKFKVIQNTEGLKSFEKEVDKFLSEIKGELIKISTDRHWKIGHKDKIGTEWIAFITYRD